MAIAERLGRYAEFARFLAKYGRGELVAGGDAAINPSEPSVLDTNAEAFARDIETLGPTFVKLGQMLSTRAELLPPAYIDALERLQDDVEPFAYADVIATVQSELGVRLSKAFAEFDETPVAAASLGQVHHARLRSGQDVAVKVQRPGVRERVLQDLEALDDVAVLLGRYHGIARGLDIAQVLDEFRRTVLRELDYQQEARNMVTIARQLRDFERIIVPLPVEDYTTTRVLTMAYIEGTKITKVSPLVWTEADGSALANDLFRAYLRQILVNGFFHADPHPGNVLLTPDHRLALIDLGMVGRLSHALQEQLFRLMLVIADGRADDAATIAMSMGERLDTFEEAEMRRVVAHMVGEHQGLSATDLNVGRAMLHLVRSAHRCGLRMPAELPLLGKTLLNLHHIGRILDEDFDVNGSMRRNATSLMRRRLLRAATSGRVLSSTLEIREFAQRLPERANRILDALAANDLRVKVEVIDHGSIIDGLQKVANRIALGVVLAALIVGAAMLMRVQTEFTIFGYPGIAMLLFLAAAAGGCSLAWTILAGDVRRAHNR